MLLAPVFDQWMLFSTDIVKFVAEIFVGSDSAVVKSASSLARTFAVAIKHHSGKNCDADADETGNVSAGASKMTYCTHSILTNRHSTLSAPYCVDSSN